MLAERAEIAEITAVFASRRGNRAQDSTFSRAVFTLFVRGKFDRAPEERVAPPLRPRALAGGMLLFSVLVFLYWTIGWNRRSRRTPSAK
jgi:hypothetical protein